MSARSAFGRPLTAPGPKRPGETRLPGAGKELTRPAGTKEADMQQFDQDWLELGFRVAKAMHYQARWARSYQELAAIEAEATAGQ